MNSESEFIIKVFDMVELEAQRVVIIANHIGQINMLRLEFVVMQTQKIMFIAVQSLATGHITSVLSLH
ncbi:MAG: hypothetical protein WKF36_09485 [Candidatus Nitrosocosmicus sp.]